MMAQKARLYSGADSVRAMEAIRQTHANQEAWPYEHVFPPVNSIPVNATDAVVTPAQAAVATVLSYKVPSGFKLILTGIIQSYINAGGLGAFVPGAALWTVTLNTPVGVANVQASSLQGLTNVKVPMGSFLAGNVWYFARAYEFAPLDILRSTVLNVALGVGDPNYFASAFLGWLVPAIKEPK